MIKKKQLKLAFLLISILLCLFLLKNKFKKTKEDVLYGENWKAGQKVFLKNCAQCHVPMSKHQEFSKFNKSIYERLLNYKKNMLLAIFKDTLHSKVTSDIELNDEIVESIIEYIETP